MTQPLPSAPTSPDSGAPTIIRLERPVGRQPALAEEMRRRQLLTEALAARHQQAEQALGAWRAALARRWACEVAAQRVYKAAQRELALHRGDDPSEPFAPILPGVASTPPGLLHELRRIAAVLELLAPRSPSVAGALVGLCIAGDELEAAIADTDSCEAERRRLMSEERVVARLLERSERRVEQQQHAR